METESNTLNYVAADQQPTVIPVVQPIEVSKIALDKNNEQAPTTLKKTNQPIKIREVIRRGYFHCRVWFSFAYILEWILSILLIAISEIFFGTYFGIVPINQRYGPILSDPFVQFPIVPELTPAAVLLTIPIFAPILIVIIINLIYVRSLHDFHHYCLGLLESMSVTWFITNVLKIIVGRPRPYFIAFCQPRDGLSATTVITDDLCTTVASLQEFRNVRMSFPSGHASFSFTALLFFSYYLAGKLAIFSTKLEELKIFNKVDFSKNEANIGRINYMWQQFKLYWTRETKSLWKLIFVCSPLLFACWVAVSRNLDYRHNFDDSLAGVLIGVFSATILYFYNFHSLFGTHCDLPRHHYWTKERIITYQRTFEKEQLMQQKYNTV